MLIFAKKEFIDECWGKYFRTHVLVIRFTFKTNKGNDDGA